MAYKILIADDDPDIVEFLKYNLELNEFIVYVSTNGREAIKIAIKENPDLILLDIMMPELDGIEVCRDLRERSDFKETIIVFLTARGEDYSQIAGFEVGADDYITKPIRPKVLIARLSALLKRKHIIDNSSEDMSFGILRLDKKRRIVLLNESEIHFPKKEFDILILLASKPEVVFTREQIYYSIWGNQIYVGDRTIDVHIRKIREKIGPKYIKTIKGIGYKFLKNVNN
jgi:two-component system, OmpR family, alkaline phosphatase synthesis response regulator PhoP